MCNFKGAGVAIVTPFHEDGTVDFETLGQLIEFQIANKTDAIVICGTTGEASTLTDDEQVECVRFTAEKVNHRIPVIAGAGSNDTKHGAELSQACQDVGADGILSVTPYYNKATQKGLIKHYTTIAEAVTVPVILYNVPGRTGLNIAASTACELSKVPNIMGIKEASGNFSQIAKIAAGCEKDFALYSGNDDQVLPMLALGAQGVISVASNIIPEAMHNMVHFFLDGKIQDAIDLQLKYIELMDMLFCEVNPIPVKAALELMGKTGQAFYRAPLCEMEDANKEKLKSALAASGLI